MAKIVLIGMMGAGKTTVGQLLSEFLNLKFVDLDAFIEERLAMSISDIFMNYGETHFRLLEKLAFDDVLTSDIDIISTGGGLVLGEENRALIKQRTFCIFLDAGVETIRKRLEKDQSRPLLKDKKIEDILKDRIHLYHAVSDFTIATDEMTIEEIVEMIVGVLNENSYD